MDKPARLVVAAMETRPEQPEAPPFRVLDTVIVADHVNVAGAVRLPPFIGNPLRSIGASHAMPAAPPGEAKRRVVRQQPKCLDRLRRLEQPDRPWRFVGDPHNGRPRTIDRHSYRGTLGNVAFARLQCSNNRIGLGGLLGTSTTVDRGRSIGTLTEARSGMWLSRASIRDSAAGPNRLPSRSNHVAINGIDSTVPPTVGR
jgi:hypothetical protein